MESLQTEDFCQQTILHVTCETQESTILTFGQFVLLLRQKPPPQSLPHRVYVALIQPQRKAVIRPHSGKNNSWLGLEKDQTPLGNVICSIRLKMTPAALYCRYSKTWCVTTPKVPSASAGATEGRHKMLLLDALGVGTGL